MRREFWRIFFVLSPSSWSFLLYLIWILWSYILFTNCYKLLLLFLQSNWVALEFNCVSSNSYLLLSGRVVAYYKNSQFWVLGKIWDFWRSLRYWDVSFKSLDVWNIYCFMLVLVVFTTYQRSTASLYPPYRRWFWFSLPPFLIIFSWFSSLFWQPYSRVDACLEFARSTWRPVLLIHESYYQAILW